MCFVVLTHQHCCAPVVEQCARLLSAQAKLCKCACDTSVNFRCLRSEIQFQISIRDLLLSHSRLMRHSERGISTSRSFKIVKCAVVTALKQSKVSNVALDPGQRDWQAGSLGLLDCLFIEFFCRFELMQKGVSIRQTIVYCCQLGLIVDSREAFASGALKLLGFVIAVSSKAQVAEVVLDFA